MAARQSFVSDNNPAGFFRAVFFISKIQTARRLQREIGGEIVFFYHDSDHDPRETVTILRDRAAADEQRLQFPVREQTAKTVLASFRQASPARMAGANRAAASELRSGLSWSKISRKFTRRTWPIFVSRCIGVSVCSKGFV